MSDRPEQYLSDRDSIQSDDVFDAARFYEENDDLFEGYYADVVSPLDVHPDAPELYHGTHQLKAMDDAIGDREVVCEKRTEVISEGMRAVRIEKRVRK